MTKFRWFLIICVAGLTGLIIHGSITVEKQNIIKVTAPLNRDHPTASSLLVFKEKMEEFSNGEFEVRIFFDSQLGSADQTLNLARMGDVEMALISSAVMVPYVHEINAIAMPFIWEGSEHQRRVLDGEVGDRLRRYARPKGIEILGFLDSGTRNISNSRRPIEKPEDLQGMNIRVMGQPLMFATMGAIGASAMSLNMGEVYTGLQMGVVDGWENNPTTIASYRMWETGTVYYSWTHHLSLPDLLIAGRPFIDSLTEEQMRWVTEAVEATIQVQRELWEMSEKLSIRRMEEAGMIINDVDLESFRARVQPLYEQYFLKYGDEFTDLVALIQMEQQQHYDR